MREGQTELKRFIIASQEICKKELAFLEKLPELPLELPAAEPAFTPAAVQPEPAPPPEPEPEPVVSHLMVAGDIMSHMPLTNDCYVKETDSYDYTHVLQEAAEQLALVEEALVSQARTALERLLWLYR